MLDNLQNVALKYNFNEPYDPKEPIINLYKQIQKLLELEEDADNIEFTTGKVIYIRPYISSGQQAYT